MKHKIYRFKCPACGKKFKGILAQASAIKAFTTACPRCMTIVRKEDILAPRIKRAAWFVGRTSRWGLWLAMLPVMLPFRGACLVSRKAAGALWASAAILVASGRVIRTVLTATPARYLPSSEKAAVPFDAAGYLRTVGRRVFVDPCNGNDYTGDGSGERPYLTSAHAFRMGLEIGNNFSVEVLSASADWSIEALRAVKTEKEAKRWVGAKVALDSGLITILEEPANWPGALGGWHFQSGCGQAFAVPSPTRHACDIVAVLSPPPGAAQSCAPGIAGDWSLEALRAVKTEEEARRWIGAKVKIESCPGVEELTKFRGASSWPWITGIGISAGVDRNLGPWQIKAVVSPPSGLGMV